MQTNTFKKQVSPLREALMLVWDLNIRAIPTALVWAVSLMFIFQSPTLITHVVCSVICSLLSLLNVAIVKFSHKRVSVGELIKCAQFKKIAALNLFVGILSVVALNNALNLNPSSIWVSLALKSSALSLLIAWLGLMLIFNPLFVSNIADQERRSSAEIFMLYVTNCKKQVLLTGVIVVVTAPLIFIFISIALTLTQALTIVTSKEMLEAQA
jgi:hypothetical protein